MLNLSFTLLLLAAAFGTVLAGLHLRAGRVRPPSWVFGALHGLIGIIGLVLLFPVLQGPPRGEAMGVGGFGSIAAVLLVLGLLASLALAAARLRRKRPPGLAIGIHATLAVSGVVILAAYALLG
jgi:asparagine N-glycosylation enzyme membrane subunit Stt3